MPAHDPRQLPFVSASFSGRHLQHKVIADKKILARQMLYYRQPSATDEQAETIGILRQRRLHKTGRLFILPLIKTKWCVHENSFCNEPQKYFPAY
jgi:hypothetical protein